MEALWHEILPEGDFMLRPRMSRIYYKGKFLDYPLRAINVLRNIGLWEGILSSSPICGPASAPPRTSPTTRTGW